MVKFVAFLSGGGSLTVKQGTRDVRALFVSARTVSGGEHRYKLGLNAGCPKET